ncbi:MAG: IS1595 family transposase [Bullifex sp.]
MANDSLSVYEFMRRFPNEDAAREYLEEKRWGDTVVCPYCGKVHIQKRAVKGYYRCLDCKKDFTVRVGTIFERSHISLDKWLYAIYQMINSRKGVSSIQLSKEIGITQKSAWFMLQRIREALGDDGDNKLEGIVEADGTYVGGKETNRHNSQKKRLGRGAAGKTCVLGMKERGGEVKAKVIPSTDKNTVHDVINDNVAPSSVVCTDEHPSYNGIPYAHLIVNHKVKQFVDEMASTNGIESFWALLKRGYYGIYHHMSVKHLQKYVNEFCFRQNEGKVVIPVMEAIGEVFGKAIGKRLTYRSLTMEVNAL